MYINIFYFYINVSHLRFFFIFLRIWKFLYVNVYVRYILQYGLDDIDKLWKFSIIKKNENEIILNIFILIYLPITIHYWRHYTSQWLQLNFQNFNKTLLFYFIFNKLVLLSDEIQEWTYPQASTMENKK